MGKIVIRKNYFWEVSWFAFRSSPHDRFGGKKVTLPCFMDDKQSCIPTLSIMDGSSEGAISSVKGPHRRSVWDSTTCIVVLYI